jgi:hypothetical protein
MIRIKVKGTRFKAASSPENEPDFYSMPFVTPLPSDTSSCVIPCTAMSCVAQQTLPQYSADLNPIPLECAVQESTTHLKSLQQFLDSDAKAELSSKNPVSVGDSVSDGYLIEEDDGTLEEFALDWDQSFDETFEMTLRDDTQLGFMLEKLLEE